MVFDDNVRELAGKLEYELRQYFLKHTADISKTFTVPIWRGSSREKRLLERLGLQDAAEAYYREIEKKKYEAVIVNKSAATHSVAHSRRNTRSAGGGSPKNRKANLQRLRPDDPLAALQLAVPAPVIEQSIALQPIQDFQALHILPLAPPSTPPMQMDAMRLDSSMGGAQNTVTAGRVGGVGPLLVGVGAAQLSGAHPAGEEPPLMIMPMDAASPAPEQRLPVKVIRDSQQEATDQSLEGLQAQPAAARPQPSSDDRDAEPWQASEAGLSMFPQLLKPSTEQAAGHNDTGAAKSPSAEDQDPFAATFPTSLIAPTMAEAEPDEWDTFQAPEEEAPQQQSSTETDLLGVEGGVGTEFDAQLPDLTFMLSTELIVPTLEHPSDADQIYDH